MYKMKYFSFIIAVCLLFSFICTGCGGSDATPKTDETTQSVSTADGGEKSSAAEQPPVKLTMFMSDSGAQFSEKGVDPNDNPILNWLEEKANVDLEVTLPPYADFKTKFSLMMASGDITDIVHCWFKNDVNKYGSEGAFIDWTPYIASTTLSNYYSEELQDLMKTDEGKIFALSSLDDRSGEGVYARIDLINEINGGKVPVTPNEWYEYMKKIKEKYSDAVPMSGVGFKLNDMFFRAYGVKIGEEGAVWQLENGKFINAFESAKCRESIEYHKKLYAEGLLDSTFVTNTGDDKAKKIKENRVCIFRGDAGQFVGSIANNKKLAEQGFESLKGAFSAFVPFSQEPGTDPENVYLRKQQLGWHYLAVNSKCKDKDAAVRVAEVLLSPEYKDICAWGIKDLTYAEKSDGTRVPDITAMKEYAWRSSYAFMRSFWYKEALDVKLQTEVFPEVTSEEKENYLKYWNEGFETLNKQTSSIASVDPLDRLPAQPDLAPKLAEAKELSLSIVYKAILGEISMDEYEKQVADFLKKYQFITDKYNELYQEYLAKKK